MVLMLQSPPALQFCAFSAQLRLIHRTTYVLDALLLLNVLLLDRHGAIEVPVRAPIVARARGAAGARRQRIHRDNRIRSLHLIVVCGLPRRGAHKGVPEFGSCK